MRLIDADLVLNAIDAQQTYKLFDEPTAEKLIAVHDAHNAVNYCPTATLGRSGKWNDMVLGQMGEGTCSCCGITVEFGMWSTPKPCDFEAICCCKCLTTIEKGLLDTAH